MKRIAFITMFSVAVLAAGCQDEKYSSSDTGLCHLHFTGTTESYVHDTRTVMDEDMNVVWEQGDQVSIFVGKTLNQRFQVEDDCAGNTDGAFDQVSTPGFVSSTEIPNNVAYYPYSSSISVVPGVHDYAVIATLPSQQTYASNSFGSGAFPMVAVTADRNDTNLKFKNVLGAIKLQIKGTAAICNISLTGNNDENLCGRVSITAGNSSLPSLSFPSEGGKTVTLDCGSGIQLNEATVTNFIIALPPTTFTKGFTVIMTDSDGHQMIVSTEKQKVINRSAFLKMAEIIYCGHELLDGHEYVDLGLPSGNLWATANVGANRPEQYGDYFAWGETEPYYEAGYALENPQSHWKSGKSGGYVWSSYRFCNGSYTTMNKYCNDPYYGGGYTDDRTVLDPADDAAHVNWGGDWRMPTVDEFEELIKTDGITRTWYDVGNTEFGGVPGYKFISNISGYEGNWIFLPASGFREGSQLNAGEDLSYWSSSLDLDHPSCGYCLHHYSGLLLCSYISRDYGCPVRPVCPNPNYVKVTSVTLSQSSITMNVGSSATLTAEVYPLNATNKKVTWSSSDSSVATVDGDGTVYAVSDGITMITAKTKDGGIEASCLVLVKTKVRLTSLSIVADRQFAAKALTSVDYMFYLPTKDKEIYLGSTSTTVKFQINPAEVDPATALEGIIKNALVMAVDSRADNSPSVGDNSPIYLKSISQNKNIITVKFSSDNMIAFPQLNSYSNMFALQVNYDGETFTSDYAYVYAENKVTTYPIVHKDCRATERFDYRTVRPTNGDDVDADYYENLNSPKLYWRETLDLKEYVDLWVGKRLSTLDYDGDVVYTFEFAGDNDKTQVYLGKDGRINQNDFVNLTADGIMTVKDKYKGTEASAAINRTPLVKVTAKINGNVVSSAFIKVLITDTPAVEVIENVLVQTIRLYENGKQIFSKDLYVGETYVLPEPQINPSDASNKQLRYQPEQGGRITYRNGIVTAIKAGSSSITISATDGSGAYCQLIFNIMNRPVQYVSLDRDDVTVKPGKTFTLVPSFYPANATIQTVTWESDNTSVATVSSKGVVTAKTEGVTYITVTSTDGGKTAKCKVTVANVSTSEDVGFEDWN